MQLVISATSQEAYDFAAQRLGIPQTSVTPVDHLDDDGIPGNVDQIVVHWLSSSAHRRDLHHVRDLIRDAKYRRASVTEQTHDDWVYVGRRAQVKPEPLPAGAKTFTEAQVVEMTNFAADTVHALKVRIERLQRACARYRAELAVNPTVVDADETPAGPVLVGPNDHGVPADLDLNDEAAIREWLEDEVTVDSIAAERAQLAEQQQETPPFDKGGTLQPGDTRVAPDEDDNDHDDLKARARELGIRVTSQKAPRLREQIAAAEAAQAKPKLSEPPF